MLKVFNPYLTCDIANYILNEFIVGLTDLKMASLKNS